jgi:hypothetical protein
MLTTPHQPPPIRLRATFHDIQTPTVDEARQVIYDHVPEFTLDDADCTSVRNDGSDARWSVRGTIDDRWHDITVWSVYWSWGVSTLFKLRSLGQADAWIEFSF